MENSQDNSNVVTYRKLVNSFRSLDLEDTPVIAHASLSSFGLVKGGAESVVAALIDSFAGVVMPTFTYKTMITPEKGPENNGITYGSGHERNMMAEFFRHDMPADELMGTIAETLRNHPNAVRSEHPIYSFSGVNADEVIKTQTLDSPFGPIETLVGLRGWVLLIGVDHTVNTSIHYGEQLVGRKQFIRWALAPQGILSCPHWPGCSNGFNQISFLVNSIKRNVKIGLADVQAFPLKDLIAVVKEMIVEDPDALLCDDNRCERCMEVRNSIS